MAAGFEVAPLCTHASPRVGDTQFAENFYEQIGGDITVLPTASISYPTSRQRGDAANAAANFYPWD